MSWKVFIQTQRVRTYMIAALDFLVIYGKVVLSQPTPTNNIAAAQNGIANYDSHFV